LPPLHLKRGSQPQSALGSDWDIECEEVDLPQPPATEKRIFSCQGKKESSLYHEEEAPQMVSPRDLGMQDLRIPTSSVVLQPYETKISRVSFDSDFKEILALHDPERISARNVKVM